MKTPEKIKKGLKYCSPRREPQYSISCHKGCPYANSSIFCRTLLHDEVGMLLEQYESTVSQVSEALCGKENATLDELLTAVDQLKADRVADNNDGRKIPRKVEMALLCLNSQDPTCNLCDYFGESQFAALIGRDIDEYIKQLNSRLAQAELERDAAVFDLHGDCDVCKNGGKTCMKCVHCLMSQEATMDGWEWRGVCAENLKEEN